MKTSSHAVVANAYPKGRFCPLPHAMTLCDDSDRDDTEIVAWCRDNGVAIFGAGDGHWLRTPVPSGRQWGSDDELERTVNAWRVAYDELDGLLPPIACGAAILARDESEVTKSPGVQPTTTDGRWACLPASPLSQPVEHRLRL